MSAGSRFHILIILTVTGRYPCNVIEKFSSMSIKTTHFEGVCGSCFGMGKLSEFHTENLGLNPARIKYVSSLLNLVLHTREHRMCMSVVLWLSAWVIYCSRLHIFKEWGSTPQIKFFCSNAFKPELVIPVNKYWLHVNQFKPLPRNVWSCDVLVILWSKWSKRSNFSICKYASNLTKDVQNQLLKRFQLNYC